MLLIQMISNGGIIKPGAEMGEVMEISSKQLQQQHRRMIEAVICQGKNRGRERLTAHVMLASTWAWLARVSRLTAS